jgi:peptide/nickel transport system ATP-binding protein
MDLLQIRDFSVDFVTDDGIVRAVDNISFAVKNGETVAVVGESGSGKSVTALSILKLLPVSSARYRSGEILFSTGENTAIDLLHEPEREMQKIRGNQIAMIFQEPMTSLNPVLTCGNQVEETIQRHKKLAGHEARQQALRLFEKVKLPDPENIFHRYPHQLSGGQKQRVMIAIAMSCSPSVLICDEPTTALDVTVQKAILQLIKELQQAENMGVIFITHDLGIVAEIADLVVVLYKGKIVEEGNVNEIFKHPRHPYTKGLLNCRPVLHQKGERLPVVSDFMEPEEKKANAAPGNKDTISLQQWAPASQQSYITDEPLIKVEQLNVWYPSSKTLFGRTAEYIKAVDGVDFEVYRGETLGLVGESGCGKTTLGRALLRLVEPDSGKIIFNGMNLLSTTKDELKKLRKDIQIVFQDPYSSLNPRITVGDAIKEPMKVHRLVEPEWQRNHKVAALLEKVQLNREYARRYPHEFSGGQRQRIVIARALALNPSFVVFDESVSALDVSVQAQVLNLINDLKTEFGFTVIFISHDLSVVHYISDRIMVMNQGKIEEIGSAGDIFHHPRKEYTKKLISSIPARRE